MRGRCCCKPEAMGAKCEDEQASKSAPLALNAETAGHAAKDAWRYAVCRAHSPCSPPFPLPLSLAFGERRQFMREQAKDMPE